MQKEARHVEQLKITRWRTRIFANLEQVFHDLKEEGTFPELGLVIPGIQTKETLKVLTPAARFSCSRKVEDLPCHQLHSFAEREMLDAFFGIGFPADSAAEGST